MTRWKQYLLEEEIDICCVTESRLDARRDGIFEEMFGDVFNCFIRSRKHMKRRDPGSGGVVVLVKKDIGVARLIKNGKCEDLVWVEVEGKDTPLYIASVYMVHARSNWQSNNMLLPSELEEDIITFKNHGLVLVSGDFNSRIAETISAGYMSHRRLRSNIDKEMNANGRELLAMMFACEMTITTGLFGKAEYTCWRDRGNSVINHICINSRHAWRIQKLRTHDEAMNRINTDHCMVVADLIWAKGPRLPSKHVSGSTRGKKAKVIALNRISNKKVWQEFKDTCDKSHELELMVTDPDVLDSDDNTIGRPPVEDR